MQEGRLYHHGVEFGAKLPPGMVVKYKVYGPHLPSGQASRLTVRRAELA